MQMQDGRYDSYGGIFIFYALVITDADSGFVKLVMMTNVFFNIEKKLKSNCSYALNR